MLFRWRFFSPAAEQDHQALTVPTKVDSITGSEVDAVFLKPPSNALCRSPDSVKSIVWSREVNKMTAAIVKRL